MASALLLAALLCWLPPTVPAAEPVLYLTPGQDSFQLAPHLEILEDPTGSLTVAQVTSPAWVGRFRPSRSQSISLGITTSAFWFRFRLERRGGPREPKSFILNLAQPVITFATLYAPETASGKLKAWRAQRPLNRAGRVAPEPGRFFHFRLTLVRAERRTYYLRLQSPGGLTMTPKISTPEGFSEGLLWRMLIYGALSGALLGLACYHLAIFFSIRDRNYLWFALIIFMATIYFMCMSGFLPVSGPAGALLNLDLPSVAMGAVFFLRLLFTKSFLPMKRFLPRMDHWLFWIMMVLPPLSVMAVIGQTRLLAIKIFMALGLIMPVLILTAAAYCWRKGFRPARYFVFAYLLTGLGALSFVIGAVGRLPFPFPLFHAHQAALCLEGILLALALGSRIKSLRQEQEAMERASEAEMRAHQDKLQALLGQLVNSEERQRRRIAENLHDSVTQDLTAGLWRLRNLRQDTPDGLAGELEGVCNSLDHSLKDIRSLTFEISPPELYEYGLSAGLEALAARMASRHGLPVVYEPSLAMPRLDTGLEVNLFRMGQELLVNVFKHAKADGAVLSLRVQGGKVVLSVKDNGIGFPPGNAQVEQASGFGIFSIRERLRIIGGSLQVDSKPGEGSRVTITLPLPLASTTEQGASP